MRSIVTAFLLAVLMPVYVAFATYGTGAYGNDLYSVTTPETSTTSSGGVSGSIPRRPVVVTTVPPVQPTTPSVTLPPAPSILTITRNLSWKARGEDVRTLQRYLNTHGYPVAPSGVGSLGKETTYFGLATKAALVKFQLAHKILPATGTFGPKTRAFVKVNP